MSQARKVELGALNEDILVNAAKTLGLTATVQLDMYGSPVVSAGRCQFVFRDGYAQAMYDDMNTTEYVSLMTEYFKTYSRSVYGYGNVDQSETDNEIVLHIHTGGA